MVQQQVIHLKVQDSQMVHVDVDLDVEVIVIQKKRLIQQVLEELI